MKEQGLQQYKEVLAQVERSVKSALVGVVRARVHGDASDFNDEQLGKAEQHLEFILNRIKDGDDRCPF